MADPSALTVPILHNGGDPQAAIPPPAGRTVTADEIALYDRQIRLWGMAAQAKIQSANVLLITIRALANEVAKNLVLAGVASLTLLDDARVTEADLGAQFLLAESEHPEEAAPAGSSPAGGKPGHGPDHGTRPGHGTRPSPVGLNRAEAALPALQRLNPRVRIHADTAGVRSKPPSYFAGFDVVIATDLDPDALHLINTATRVTGRAFYAAGMHGLYGFIFSDLIEHDFVIRREVGNVPARRGPETRTRAVVAVSTIDGSGAGSGAGSAPRPVEAVTKRELYSTWLLASDAALLPPEFTRSRRRLRSVSPVLSCLRALWAFMQAHAGRAPSPSSRDDLRLFTQLATLKHRALSLPAETLRPDLLRSFLQNLGCELAPTAAILGGQLAQDVINVLGQTQQPIQNMVVFDGNTMEAPMYAFHPDGALGAGLLSLGADLGPVVPGPDMMPAFAMPTAPPDLPAQPGPSN
ncbi:DNA damage tolerance protein RHC31 [Escovopsis weberi]|uniref:DNA damage tolerance protein RHC31 n=1 Tax=Escovopsis weberi TaxID=150374 RepID=A0A0M8MTG8_ESCWE|nr:DNA damage tolerance protein RHC31 [Escovopsis weberi]